MPTIDGCAMNEAPAAVVLNCLDPLGGMHMMHWQDERTKRSLLNQVGVASEGTLVARQIKRGTKFH